MPPASAYISFHISTGLGRPGPAGPRGGKKCYETYGAAAARRNKADPQAHTLETE